MRLIYILFFLTTYLFCKTIIAQTIAVVNIQFLIDNNKYYIEKIKNIEINQEKYLNSFENREEELNIKLSDIEESKLILNQNEINIKIEEYNKQLFDFTNLVEEYNLHYQNQIINIRQSVLKELIVLLEKYAIDNKIDLILDSTSYLIASNSIDITNIINNELNKINLKLEYRNFEKD